MTEKTLCQDCPMKRGCWATTLVQPNDVLLGPCGKAYGYSNNNTFWAAPADAWRARMAENSTEPPAGIEWCRILGKVMFYTNCPEDEKAGVGQGMR